jgi:hypothetical protein
MSWYYQLVREKKYKIRLYEIVEEINKKGNIIYLWGYPANIIWAIKDIKWVIKDLIYSHSVLDIKALQNERKEKDVDNKINKMLKSKKFKDLIK